MRLLQARGWERPGNEAASEGLGMRLQARGWEWPGCKRGGGNGLGMRLQARGWERPGNEAASEGAGMAWE